MFYSISLGKPKPFPLLVTLIAFTSPGCNGLILFPFPATTKLKPSLPFSSISHMLDIFASTWDTWYMKHNFCCFQKLPPQATNQWHLLGKIPPRSHGWHFWERSQSGTLEINKRTKQMAPVEAAASCSFSRTVLSVYDLPVSLGHYSTLLEPFDIISYRMSLALDTRFPQCSSQPWCSDI